MFKGVIMDILTKAVHTVKPHATLYLDHQVFPYPPFAKYACKVSPKTSVTIKEINGYTSGLEGAPIDQRVEFIFAETGEYNVTLTDLSDDIKTHIKVICEN